MRTQAPAVAAADGLHGDRQENLLGQHVGQKQAVAFEEGDLGVVQLQAELFLPGDRLQGPVKQVENRG